MESRLPRSRLMDHHLKESLLSPPISSHSHTSPPCESYGGRQRLLRDAGFPVAPASKGQDVAKNLHQESREKGDSKIPIYVTLAKSSLSATPEDGGQWAPSTEQWTGHESGQDRTYSAKIESATQSKPETLFIFDHSNSENSGRGSRGLRLPTGTLKSAEEAPDEVETTHTAKWLGKNEMFAGSRVRDLKEKFEAVGEKQSKRNLEKEKVRKGEVQNSISKGEQRYRQQTSCEAPTLDVGKTTEPLTNEIASDLKKRDLSAFPAQQQSISSHSPYRRWMSMYPRSALSLPNQRPSTVNKKSEALLSQERPDQPPHQQSKSRINPRETDRGRTAVVRGTTDDQQSGNNGTTSADEQFFGSQTNETKIDPESEKSCHCPGSVPEKKFSREEAETNSSERPPNYSSNTTRLASRKLDQPKGTDGVINPVGRVHSEPLTPSTLIETGRSELRQSPMRRIFETQSDKTVSQTANSGHQDEEKEEEEVDRDRDRAWYRGERDETKRRRAEVHRSLTDHRVEGGISRNKCVSNGITFDDSIELPKQHQQNDELVSCLRPNSGQDEDDEHAGENSQLLIVAEDKDPIQLATEAQIGNTDEQKQLGVSETRSTMTSLCRHIQRSTDNERSPLSTLPSPSSVEHSIKHGAEPLQLPPPPPPALLPNCDYSVPTENRYRLRSDCSSYKNRLTRPSTYSSLGDFYLSSSGARRNRMRRIAESLSSDYSYGLSLSNIVQPATQKKTQLLSFDRESSLPPPPSSSPPPPPQSANESSRKQTKAPCELSENNLKETREEEGGGADPVRPRIWRTTTSKECLAEQTPQPIESDKDPLKRQTKASLEDAPYGSATSLTAKHRLPNKTTAQNSFDLTANDRQIEKISEKSDNETSKDQFEVKHDVDFVSHQTDIDRNEKLLPPSTEVIDVPEGQEPIEEPVGTSLLSAKPVSGFISMYRTRGPLRTKFPDIDCKATMVLPVKKSDPRTPQTVSLQMCRPKSTRNQAKSIDRNASISKPLTKLSGDGGVFRQRTALRGTKSRQKRSISPYLHASWSTDSTTTDCCALDINAAQLHAPRSRDELKRRQDGNDGGGFEAIATAAPICRDDRVSNFDSFANFRTVFRQKRQQLTEEEEEEDDDDTWSAEELLKDYSHPLWLSDNESDVESNDVSLFHREEDSTEQEDTKLQKNTRDVERQKTEQENAVITKQMLIDQNRLLFEGAQILQFRQRVCLMLIGMIFMLIFYMKIFPLFAVRFF